MTSVTIELFSKKLPIKTQHTEEHIEELVRYVGQKLDELDPDRRVPDLTLAILALLNIADELCKERMRVRELKEAIRAKSNFLLEKVEQSGYLC